MTRIDVVNSALLFTSIKREVASVSLLLNKDFKQTRFARLKNNTYLYIKSSNKKVKEQYTRKIDQE